MELTDVGCVTEIGIVGDVQKDQKERQRVNNEPEDYDRISSDFVCNSSAHKAERNSTSYFTDADENSWKSHQLFCWFTDCLRKANAGGVNATEER